MEQERYQSNENQRVCTSEQLSKERVSGLKKGAELVERDDVPELLMDFVDEQGLKQARLAHGAGMSVQRRSGADADQNSFWPT